MLFATLIVCCGEIVMLYKYLQKIISILSMARVCYMNACVYTPSTWRRPLLMIIAHYFLQVNINVSGYHQRTITKVWCSLCLSLNPHYLGIVEVHDALALIAPVMTLFRERTVMPHATFASLYLTFSTCTWHRSRLFAPSSQLIHL